jgi:adenylylsulfate kinase-like enzyme
MSWDWAHFKDEGWLAHTKRSARLAALLLASGGAMILHLLVPFWQQPRKLQREEVAAALCEGLEIHKE